MLASGDLTIRILRMIERLKSRARRSLTMPAISFFCGRLG